MSTQPDMTEVPGLVARGGWTLEDPAPRVAEHPDTFEMPTASELGALGPGSVVRAMFRTLTIADPVRDRLDPYDAHGNPVLVPISERMWLAVIERDGDMLDCALTNLPFATHTRLQPNDRVRLPVNYVIATGEPLPDVPGFLQFLQQWENDPANPRIDPATPIDPLAPPRLSSAQQAVIERTGARPHPPLPFAKCVMSKNVTADSVPLYGARMQPKPERFDSGWIFFTGPPDFDYVNKNVGFDIMSLQEASQRHPRIQAYLPMAPGWGFSLLGEGSDDLYPID